jgi:hypothetical protein
MPTGTGDLVGDVDRMTAVAKSFIPLVTAQQVQAEV